MLLRLKFEPVFRECIHPLLLSHSPSYRPNYRHATVESVEDVKRRKQQAIVSLSSQVYPFH